METGEKGDGKRGNRGWVSVRFERKEGDSNFAREIAAYPINRNVVCMLSNSG